MTAQKSKKKHHQYMYNSKQCHNVEFFLTTLTSKSPGPPKNVSFGPVSDRLWFNTTEGDKEIKQLYTIRRAKNTN